MARRRVRPAPGWGQTLLGAAVLVVLGFGVGLVAGAGLRDPALVVQHLVGEGADVALPGEDDPVGPQATWTATPETPAERPLGAAEGAPPAVSLPRVGTGFDEVAAPVAAAPAAGRSPEPAPRSGWAVQVGAFDDGSAAEALVGKLRSRSLDAYVVEVAGDGPAWRVRVGPYASRDLADATAAELSAEQGLPVWVLSEDGP